MGPSRGPYRVRQRAIRAGFRSGLEQDNATLLKRHRCAFEYEEHRFPYHVVKHYTPDFKLHNGVIVETKGRFLPSDRTKHLLIKKQHPELDIRFVFSNAKQKLRKGSKTTYAQWCDKNEFLWAEGLIPISWMKE